MRSFVQKILIASDHHKTRNKDVGIVAFDLVGLLSTNHEYFYITMAYM